MSTWATGLLLCALFVSWTVVIVRGMGSRGKQIAALVVTATASSAVTVAIAYRDSLDGQMQHFWFQILVWGVFALAALRILDKTVRILDQTVRRYHARMSA